MSNKNSEKIPTSASGANENQKKVISLNIQENIMNKRYVLKILKAITKTDKNYTQDFQFESPLGDSMIIKIKEQNGKLIRISHDGESDTSLTITGEEEPVQKFLHDFTVEALSILASELSLCLGSTFPGVSENNLMKEFRKTLSEAISEAVYNCTHDH